jgi:hypothetical protein
MTLLKLHLWWQKQKLLSKICGLELDIEDMNGPEYSPPNACCPSCFHGSALRIKEEELEELKKQLENC